MSREAGTTRPGSSASRVSERPRAGPGDRDRLAVDPHLEGSQHEDLDVPNHRPIVEAAGARRPAGPSGNVGRVASTGRSRRWLVDGMNVVGSKPDRWWNDVDRAVHRMVDSLQGFAERTGDETTVVFDRKPPDLEPGRHGDLVVAFAQRRGRNAADDEIVRMVAEDPDPGAITVVTSDDRLAERVEELGANVARAGGFRRRLDEASS